MTYIDQIKRLSVKVNAGSGILVKPVAGNHLFVFTAYHVIKDLDDSEIVISTAFDLTEEFSCTVIKSYHSTDTDEDAAIIEIDTTYQVEQLFLCEDYYNYQNLRHVGFPDIRRNKDEVRSDFIDYPIKEFGQMLGDKLLEYEYDKFHQQAELSECSGGGIIDGDYHLLGVHKCISNRDGREYNGKSSCVPIRNFKKLISQEDALKVITYLDLLTFESFTPKAFPSPVSPRKKIEDLKSLLVNINFLLVQINKLSPQEIYEQLKSQNKLWGDKEDIYDYKEDTWVEIVRYLVGSRLLTGIELNNDKICLIADKFRFVYSEEDFDISEARNFVKPCVIGKIDKDTIVVVGGIKSTDYDYDVCPSEQEVPDIGRAYIEENGLDISKGGKNMLAYVTFVNNKLFVDTINHNSRAIGEHSKRSLDFYLDLLKNAIYGKDKD